LLSSITSSILRANSTTSWPGVVWDVKSYMPHGQLSTLLHSHPWLVEQNYRPSWARLVLILNTLGLPNGHDLAAWLGAIAKLV
jgi:hypothetical protein